MSALVLSAFTVSITREAQAQAAPMTVSILRRTAVRSAPSTNASTIAFLNPSTFEVTQLQVTAGFVRLPLRQIDRRRPASGYGYIAAVDVAVDSATTEPARTQTDTLARPRTATVAPTRPDPTIAPRPAPPDRTRRDTMPATRADTALRPAAPSAMELMVRP